MFLYRTSIFIDSNKCKFIELYCECECHKPCNADEYLDYENCKWRKNLVDKLTEECTKNIEEVKIAKITLAEPLGEP